MANQQEDVDVASSSPPSLPDDVVAEILAYLPAKSVGRIRCASLSWHAALSSASFVKLHLRQANDKAKIFFSPTDCDNGCQFCAWQPGYAVVKKLVRNGLSLPTPLTKPLHGFILLHSVGDGGYYLCNPSTGEVRPLPDSRAPLKMASRPFPLPCYRGVVYGFGYCSANHRYKAVRIFMDEMRGRDAPPICEVLVLGGDAPASYWRPAATQPPTYVVNEKNSAVFLHEHLHFLCRLQDVILTFNVGDETFGSVPLPPCPHAWAPLRITELDGCLCVVRGNRDGAFHLWLMRDYAARRWEQLCCIDQTAWPEPERRLLQSDWLSPVGLCNGGNESEKKIVLSTGTGEVFTVDLDGGGAPEILFMSDGYFDDADYYPVLGLFQESLVTLGNTAEDMVFSSPVTKAWSDVLKWLPARSVLQLSLVCREWRAMVTSDRFIRLHAAVHATSPRPRVMFLADPFRGSFTDLEDHVGDPPLYGQPDDNPGMLQCSQPCHGLILGSWYDRDFLYNPTMGYTERLHELERNENDNTFFAGRIALGYF